MIQSTEEILSDWNPDQHLYVKGELGLGETQFAGLEEWLDQNGTNWVVVLMDTAAGEAFTDASGTRYSGMDAVEYRLGNGLPGRTSFGEWTDPRTGERNGAFFVLFLSERKFSYYGSDAQDKRGLGEDAWVGRLDVPAIAAMRGGGRIIDAAKDTVSSINQQLSQKITAEERQRQQAIAQAEARRVELESRASGLMEVAEQNLARLESEIREMRTADPQLTGGIVQPDFASWKAQLVSAKTNFDNSDFQAAVTLAESVNERIAEAARELEDYRNAVPLIGSLQAGLDELKDSTRVNHVRTQLDSAEQSLRECQQAHDIADPSYRELMESTRESIDSARAQIQAQIRNEKLARDFTMACVGGGFAALLIVGFIMNRRRRSSRKEALELIESWTRALEEKTGAASELMVRSLKTLGTSRREAEERFAGETLKLVEQTIRDVDEMMIMATCAGRILKDAEGLAKPDAAVFRAKNMFFKRRYLAAIRQLRDEPVVFRPEEGLADVLREKTTERERLLGTLDSYQPFKLSFNELIANFNQRAERALDALNQIEQSELQIADLLAEVERSIEEMRSAAEALDQRENPDGLFPVTEILETLLPSADEDYSAAAVMSISDPLGALRTSGARAREQSDDARQLVRLASDFHERTAKELLSGSERLAGLSLATEWIEDVLEDSSEAFVGAIRSAANASARDSIASVSENLAKLVERVNQTFEAETFRTESVLPAIADVDGLVRQTRSKIGSQLSLDAEKILIEEDRNPDEFVKTARGQADASLAAANRGDVESASSANAESLREVEVAKQLVTETTTAFENYDETLKTRITEAERLEESVPAHEAVLADIESQYAASVLLLGADDPAHPNANGTIRDNLEEVREYTATAGEHIRSAKEWFANGRILDSLDALESAGACQKLIASRLQEIMDKQARLKKTESENSSLLELLKSRADGLERSVQDNRTMRETQKRFIQSRRSLAQLEAEISTVGGDPFQLAENLTDLKTEIDGVESHIASDWNQHEEAVRSIRSAEQQLSVLRKLETQSARDNLPDSQVVRDAVRQISGLEEAFARIETRLQEPHGDWVALDRDADALTRQAGLTAATLRNDLRAAQEAHDKLNEAAERVRSARLWSGGYGVSILGQPGTDSLNRARESFLRGDYSMVLQAALMAERTAMQAVAEANAEVRRRERAEQQRLERERRQREQLARQMRRASRGSSFGSGSRRSSFGSRSGSSRSSFRSSSGTRRSGW